MIRVYPYSKEIYCFLLLVSRLPSQ